MHIPLRGLPFGKPQTVEEHIFLALPPGELSCYRMTERAYRIFVLQIFDIFGFSAKIQNPLRPADAGHLSHRYLPQAKLRNKALCKW